MNLRRINKVFFPGRENELQALFNVSLDIYRGEFISIVGESGSGKSTLMNILGLLDRPTSGDYYFDGANVATLGQDSLSSIRNQKIGFVFQNFNLIARTSALKNVELPMYYAGYPAKQRTKRAMELLSLMGMGERADHEPNELSGGQKQRVSIARAMANDPDIILADEPTGALDSRTGGLIMDIFHYLHEKSGKTIILITHSQELAEETERIVTVADGRIKEEREGSQYNGDFGFD
jgi:putative ABC transport system ATP-binding protein